MEFPQFVKLPLEIQRMIWVEALTDERILHVKLTGTKDTSQDASPYDITLVEWKPLSTVFHVNKLARATAEEFYRVQLPCQYRWDDKSMKDATLYLNPELDIIEIFDPENQWFAHFADDVWKKDKEHLGLLNLMIGTCKVHEALGGPDQLLQQAISRLERVIFMPETWLTEEGYTPRDLRTGRHSFERDSFERDASCFRFRSFHDPYMARFTRQRGEITRQHLNSRFPQEIEFCSVFISEAMHDWILKTESPCNIEALRRTKFQVFFPYGAKAKYDRDHFWRRGMTTRERHRAERTNWSWTDSNLNDAHIRNLRRTHANEAECLGPSGFWLIDIEMIKYGNVVGEWVEEYDWLLQSPYAQKFKSDRDVRAKALMMGDDFWPLYDSEACDDGDLEGDIKYWSGQDKFAVDELCLYG